MKKTSSNRMNAVGIWLLGLLTLLCVSWLGDLIATGDLFTYIGSSSTVRPIVIGLGLLVAYTGLSFVISRLSQNWFRPVSSLQQSKRQPVKALIVNVSPNPLSYAKRENGFEVSFSPEAIIHLPQTSLADDCKTYRSQIAGFKKQKQLRDNQNWNWQPILEALNGLDLNHLELLVLVVTDDKDVNNSQTGSLKHQGDLKMWLSGYRELDNVCVKSHRLSTCNESIESTYQGYCDILDSLEMKGIANEHIVLDVTGGTAAMSVAGSMATLHKKSRFQFVNQSTNQIENYNLIIQRPANK